MSYKSIYCFRATSSNIVVDDSAMDEITNSLQGVSVSNTTTAPPSDDAMPPESKPSLLQQLLDLPMEPFQHILAEVPFESHVALSLTCRAARQVFLSLHDNNATWASYKVVRHKSTYHPFLGLLALDLPDRYFYCYGCKRLHPFYDVATEMSPEKLRARLASAAKEWDQVDTRELFTAKGGESFRITYRQVRLMLHHVRYGHGIPPRYFCREISSVWMKEPLRLSPPRPSIASVLAPSKSLLGMVPRPPPPPRWRRRTYVGVDDSNYLYLLDRHELLYDGHDAQVVRRFLDQTPYRVCPHLVTHDPSRRNNNSSSTDDHYSDSGISAPPQMASHIVTTQPSDSTMSTAVPCNPPSPFDLLLELPIEVFDLVIEKLPVPSQVALSITCHAARKLLKHHLKDLDWTSFRREWSFPLLERPVSAVEEDCRQFLRDYLGKDLADRFVYCGDCVKLHRFCDAATELSQDFKVPTTRLPTHGFSCRWRDTELRWLFDDVGGSFSPNKRQIALVERHHLHGDGRGIPAHRFCKEIETLALWKLLLSPGPVPRWRRRVQMHPERDDYSGDWTLVVRHELVVPDGTEKRTARQYLDSAPYWICLHLRTHFALSIGSIPCDAHVSKNEALAWSLWGGLVPRKKGNYDPLKLGGGRAPGTGVVAAGVDPVFDGKLRQWVHCPSCQYPTCWKVESGWLAQANDLQHDGSAVGDDQDGGSGGSIGIKDDEGTVCFSLTMRTHVF
ncbi:hypothetical protein PG997_011665 [Apiospora hydei]|uniref:F-box domain-containing protein n=1 Tax=Apiospora hydei TaxID=1337664 RepID=A0ABR1VJQ0_9PEZI